MPPRISDDAPAGSSSAQDPGLPSSSSLASGSSVSRPTRVQKVLPQRPDAQPSDDGFAETAELLNDAFRDPGRYQEKYPTNDEGAGEGSLSAVRPDISNVQLVVASPALPEKEDTVPAAPSQDTDSLPELLSRLDDIASIHPFTQVAVAAFRVVAELELKRKENDKRIALLFIEMKDVMAILIQLKEISQDACARNDDTPISISVKPVLEKIASDIKECANFCDTWLKKTSISKVVNNSAWSDGFKNYIQLFAERKRELGFALSVYTSQTVHIANQRLESIEQKMDRILQYFEACTSPQERSLARLIDTHGGPEEVGRNEELLQRLFRSWMVSVDLGEQLEQRNVADSFRQLQREVHTDVQIAVHENLTQFQAKFSMQQREIEGGMDQRAHREGAIRTQTVVDGRVSRPHDKLVDPDMYEIWNQMNWRGSVEGRYMVVALQDHFREQFDLLRQAKACALRAIPESSQNLSDEDEWTLQYIDVTRVQPISEAFDSDASGFITVQEVNAFTSSPSRPGNWSLLRWLAFWAVGYQMSMSNYARRIDVLLAKMFALKPLVLPANRNSLEEYLRYVWKHVTTLTAAFRKVDVDAQLLHKFEDYTQAEENRLSENLKTTRFVIDARDTLDLICGPGVIEKHLFPLLYLLLKRDFEVVRLARSQCLHADELFDSMRTISQVIDATYQRHDHLADIFKQQGLDPARHFEIFAFDTIGRGKDFQMSLDLTAVLQQFKYLHDEDKIWSLKKLKTATFLEIPYDDSIEAQDVDLPSLLNHPLQSTEALFDAQDFVRTEADMQADPMVQRILGHWSGFCAQEDVYPSQEMISFDIHVSSTNPHRYRSEGIAPNGTDWNLVGEYTVSEDGDIQYSFNITYATRFSPQVFSGRLDESGTTFTGSWGFSDTPFKFMFKRLSPEAMRFYPTPTELVENKPRALWRFAFSVVRAQLRQSLCSWSHLRERWQAGQRYAELTIRSDISRLTPSEVAELAGYRRIMTPAEARLYRLFRDLRERSIPIHWDVFCDVCRDLIRGSRVVCLSCGMKTTVDLCAKERCLASEVGLDVCEDLVTPHLPSHDVLKLRVAIDPYREYGKIYRAAQSALKTVRQTFVDLVPSNGQGERTAGPDQPELISTCVKCHERTSLPCWCCIECRERVFVCVSCDAKHGGITVGEHKKVHTLIRCQPLRRPVHSESQQTEDLGARIDTLETKLQDVRCKVEDGFAGVDDKIGIAQDSLSRKMDEPLQKLPGIEERLQRIEELLRELGQKCGSRTSRDE